MEVIKLDIILLFSINYFIDMFIIIYFYCNLMVNNKMNNINK